MAKDTTILDKTVEIEPSGVIYNITNDVIEEFVENFLSSKKVPGVTKVKVQVRNEGNTAPRVAIYMFLNKNSDAVISDINAIPQMLRNKIAKVNIRLSDDFKKTILPFTGNEIESGNADNREYFVKLDIFRVIGFMVAADPARHNLAITDAKRLPNGNSIISVVKLESFNSTGGNNGDKYSRMIDNFERRH